MIQKPKPKSAGIALLTLFAVLLSGWFLWAGERARAKAAPDQEEWGEFSSSLRPLLKDRDLLRFAPVWDNLGPAAFQGTVVGSEKAPFPALDWRVYQDPVRWMGYKRLVLLGWSGYVNGSVGSLEARFGPSEVLLRQGLFAARAFTLPASPLRWNALDVFSEAKVRRLSTKKKAEVCPWNGTRHDCPGRGGWRDVNIRRMLVGDVTQTCIFMEPAPDGAGVEIMFEELELGPDQTLMVRVGNSMEAARRNAGGPLHLVVSIDGMVVTRDSYHHHDFAWIPYGIRMTKSLKKGYHQVRVTLSTEKSGYRQECLELLVLDAGWEAWGALGYGHRFRASVSEEPVKLSTYP